MNKKIRLITVLCLSLFIVLGQNTNANTINLVDTEITGRVVDTDGEPLAGVNIKSKDRIVGTSTDVNGNFSLSVSQNPPISLIFSIIGFQSIEMR